MSGLPYTRGTLGIVLAAILLAWTGPVAAQHAGHGDGGSRWRCDGVATPGADPHGQHGMTEQMATPDTAAVEVDQLYIDMMIPHHESIIALSEVALPRLTDPRLVDMAEAIVAAQTAENEQLSAWRAEWYGSPEPAAGEGWMAMMLEAMPVGTMEDMMREMDPQWQVSTFCGAGNADIAFARQAIRHHQMAVDASEAVIDGLVHPELVAFAGEVIAVQQAEIDELTAILDDLQAATPASRASWPRIGPES